MKRLLTGSVVVYLRGDLVGVGRGRDSDKLIERTTELCCEVPAEGEAGGTSPSSVSRAGLLWLRPLLWIRGWRAGFCFETPGFESLFWGKLPDFGLLLLVEASGFGLLLWRTWCGGRSLDFETFGEDLEGLQSIVGRPCWHTTGLCLDLR